MADEQPQAGRWLGPMILTDNTAVPPGGQHDFVDAKGTWHQHLYPVDAPTCWCGWTPPPDLTVTAAPPWVLNPGGTWTVEA